MLWVTPYLTSTPKSPRRSESSDDNGVRVLFTLDVAYGLTSRFLVPDGAVRPTSVAERDAMCRPPWPRALGVGERNDSSFFQRFVRKALNPHVCSVPGAYRSDLNGIAASTIQPWSNLPTRYSQIVFQSPFHW